MCRDISQLWETEQTNAKQQSEIIRLNTLMDAIINNVPVSLFVKDAGNDFRYVYWNKTFAEHSGIPLEKAIGKIPYGRKHPDRSLSITKTAEILQPIV